MLHDLIEQLTRQRSGSRRKRHRPLRHVAFHQGLARSLHLESLEDRRLLAGLPAIFDADAAASNFGLRLDATGQTVQITQDGSLVVERALATLSELTINGNSLDNMLTVDLATGNPIPAGGLFYNGGDEATEIGDGIQIVGGESYDTSYTPTVGNDGIITLTPPGPSPAEVATIYFTSLEPVQDNVVASTVTINGTDGDNAINYSPGNGGGGIFVGNTGLVSVDSFETYEFNNKTNLVLNAGNGSDTIHINDQTTPAGLTGVTVNGGDPTGSGGDRLIVNAISDPAGGDILVLVPLDQAGSMVSRSATIGVNFSGIEDLELVGQVGEGDTFGVAGTRGNDTFEYYSGLTSDAGQVRGIVSAPTALSPTLVPFALTTTSFIGMDPSVVRNFNQGSVGSDDVDRFRFVATGTSDTIVYDGAGGITNQVAGIAFATISVGTAARGGRTADVTIEGNDGADDITVTGEAGVAIRVVGGQSDSVVDTLTYIASGTGAPITVDLAAQTIEEVGFGTVFYSEIETLNIDVLPVGGVQGVMLTINALPGDDHIEVTPLTNFIPANPPNPDNGTLRVLNSSTPVVNYRGTNTIELGGGGGEDTVIVNGTSAADFFQVSETAVFTPSGSVTFNNFTADPIEALTVNGLQGDDMFDVLPSNFVPILIDGGDPTGVGDMLTVNAFNSAVYTAGPANDAGSFVVASGQPVSFDHIRQVNVFDPSNGLDVTVMGTDGDDDITATGQGFQTVDVTLNDGPVVTYTGVPNLTLQGKSGDDDITIDVNDPGLAVTFVVEGGMPTTGEGDDLRVTGAAGQADNPVWTPSAADAGVLQLAGQSPIDVRGIENLFYDAENQQETLTVNLPASDNDSAAIGFPAPGSGVVNVTAGGTDAWLGIEFENLVRTALDQLLINDAGGAGDTVYVDGSSSADKFDVAATGAIDALIGGLISAPIILPTGVENAALDGQEGDDRFTAELIGQALEAIRILGGDPSNDDSVILNQGANSAADTTTVQPLLSEPAGSARVTTPGTTLDLISTEFLRFNSADGINDVLRILGTSGDEQIDIDSANNAIRVAIENLLAGNPVVLPTTEASGFGQLDVDAGDGTDHFRAALGNLPTDVLRTLGGGGNDIFEAVGTGSDDDLQVHPGGAQAEVDVANFLKATLETIEALRATLGDGDDTLTVDPIADLPVLFDGGSPANSDRLIVNAAGSARITQGATSTSGRLDQLGGAAGEINYVNVEHLNITSNTAASALTVRATDDNDTIAIAPTGTANEGRVWINDGTVITVNAGGANNNFAALDVQGRFGNDSFSITPIANIAITAQGMDPTASDSAVVNSSNATTVDMLTFDGARVMMTGAADVTLSTIEHLTISGDDADRALTITTPALLDLITLTPGATRDSGSIQVGSFVPIDFTGLGASGGSLTLADVSGTRTDSLMHKGTGGDDSYTLAAVTGAITLAPRIVVDTPGVSNVTLEGNDGDDTFNVPGAQPYSSITLSGGDPSHTDIANVTGDGAVALIATANGDGTGLVTGGGLGAGGVRVAGIEIVRIDAAVQDVTVQGGSGDDSIEVTPLSAGTGEVLVNDGAPLFVYSNILANTVSVNGGIAGEDRVVVQGSSLSDFFTADGVAVTVGGQVINYTSEALTLSGLEGDDIFDVFTPSGTPPISVNGGDPIGILQGTGDTLNIVTSGVGFVVQAGPEQDSGDIAVGGGPPISFDEIEMLQVNGINYLFPDASEPNDDIAGATNLGSETAIVLSGLSLHDTGGFPAAINEDVYKITARETGKLIVNALFPIGAGLGDVDFEIQDTNGVVIASSQEPVAGQDQAVIPVVGQQMYLLRVFSSDNLPNNYDLEIENFAAPTPTQPDLLDASDSGITNDDDITQDDTPTIEVTADLASFANMGVAIDGGAGVAGADVVITATSQTSGAITTLDATLVDPGTPNNNLWTGTFGVLDDDDYVIEAWVRIEDGIGVVGRSLIGDPLTITIDTVAPTAPTTPNMLDASDDGSSRSDNITSNSSPTFDGLGEPNAKIRVLAEDDVVGQGEVTASGEWAVSVGQLGSGSYDITAELEDLAGNVSLPSGFLPIIVDPLEPNDTIATATVLGSIPKITLNDVLLHDTADIDFFKITAMGTGKLIIDNYFDPGGGNVVMRVLDGLGNTIHDLPTTIAGGQQIVIPVVNQQMYFLEMTLVDDTGLLSANGNLYDLEIEFFAAPTPDSPRLSPLSDTGMMNDDHLTSNDTPTYFVTADLIDFENMGIAIDQGAGVSGAEMVVGFTNTATGVRTNVLADAVGGNSAFWSATPATGLADGIYLVQAWTRIEDGQATPAAGRSLFSQPTFLTVDTVAPTISLPDLLDSSDTGMFSDDNVTSEKAPTFRGTAEANAKVRVLANGVLVGQSTATSDGRWETTIPAQQDGDYFITVEAEDAAGNVAGAGGLGIEIDTAEPNTPHLELLEDTGHSSDDNVTNVNTPIFSIATHDPNSANHILPENFKYRIFDRFEDGSEELIFDSATISATQPSGLTALSRVFTTADLTAAAATVIPVLGDGQHHLKVEIEDRAGNVSHDLLVDVIIDSVTPPAPLPDLVEASDSGANNNDDLTNKERPVFSGLSEAGASVRLFATNLATDNTFLAGEAIVLDDASDVPQGGSAGDGLGVWQITSAPLVDGEYDFFYQVVDGAGNLNVSAALTITVERENDAPVAEPDEVTTGENAPVTANVLANDTDVNESDTPANFNLESIDSVTVSGLSTGVSLITGSVNIAGKLVAFEPGTDFDELADGEEATILVVYTMSDHGGATSSSTLTIRVIGQNDAPVAIDDAYVALANATLTVDAASGVLANDSDVDTDHSLLTVSALNGAAASIGNPTTLPSGGTVTLNADGSFTYDAPTGTTATSDSFDYTVSDPDGATAQATVEITIVRTGASLQPTPTDPTQMDLVIEDLEPGGKDDNLSLRFENGDLVIIDKSNLVLDQTGGTPTVGMRVPITSITGQNIIVNLAGGNDVLDIDLSGLNGSGLDRSLTIRGGDGNDTLVFRGETSLGAGALTAAENDIEEIMIDGAITTNNAAVTLTAVQSLEVNSDISTGSGANGRVTLTADGQDIFGNCSLIDAGSADVALVSGTGIAQVRIRTAGDVLLNGGSGGIVGCTGATAVTAKTLELHAAASVGSATFAAGQVTVVEPFRTSIDEVLGTVGGLGIFLENDQALTDTVVLTDPAPLGVRDISVVPSGSSPEGEGSPLQNRNNRLDVNDDESVSPIDGLMVINYLNNAGQGSQSEGAKGKGTMAYVDVNGDREVSPIDALEIINYLNNSSASKPEGEAAAHSRSVIDSTKASQASISTFVAASDAVFAKQDAQPVPSDAGGHDASVNDEQFQWPPADHRSLQGQSIYGPRASRLRLSADVSEELETLLDEIAVDTWGALSRGE